MPQDLQLELEYWAETGEFDDESLHEVKLTFRIPFPSIFVQLWGSMAFFLHGIFSEEKIAIGDHFPVADIFPSFQRTDREKYINS